MPQMKCRNRVADAPCFGLRVFQRAVRVGVYAPIFRFLLARFSHNIGWPKKIAELECHAFVTPFDYPKSLCRKQLRISAEPLEPEK